MMLNTFWRVGFCACVLFACFSLRGGAQEFFNPDLWQVQTKPGDAVTLTAPGDCLRMDLALNVNSQTLHGHVTYNEATARLLLKQPVKLTGEQRRVIFEARGIRKTIEKESFLQLLPLVRDASGEVLRYFPYPGAQLLSGTERWGVWMTRYLYGAEAGGPTQNIFFSDNNGDANGWPDGELEFLGFAIEVHPQKFGREEHTLYLGDISFGGMRLPYEDPYLFADALADKDGTYRFAYEVCARFQADPVGQGAESFRLDSKQPALGRQRLRIPLAADGAYWLRYQITDQAGAVAGTGSLRKIVENHRAENTPLAPIAPDQAPVIGCLRINPGATHGGVYATDAPLAVTVRAFRAGAAQMQLRYRLQPYAYPTDIETGEQSVAFTPQGYADVSLAFKGEPGRDAYRLLVEAVDGDRVVDRQEYVLGRKTDLSKPRQTRQGLIRGREYVKQSAYFRTTFRPDRAKNEDEAARQFEQYLDQASQMANNLTFMLDPAEFEILPGVYDFALLDRVMDLATDRSCAITVRLAHTDVQSRYRWLPFSRQLNYDDTEIEQHFYGCYSGVDGNFLAAWKRAFRALHDRYRTHPAFQGYYLLMPSGEWLVMTDKPWIGIVAGYEKASREALVRYVQQQLKLDLAQVNQRWGTSFSDWDALQPPRPDFSGGVRPDTRLWWLDFCRFKDYINKHYWYNELVADIRSYDPQRVVIIYAPRSIKGMENDIDYAHGGGVPAMPGAGEQEYYWKKDRIGSIQEPHHPHRWSAYGDREEKGWSLDWCLYTMISLYGGGGANLHVYYYPLSSLIERYGNESAYDLYERIKPLYRELQKITLVQSARCQVATLQDPTSLYCKHRSSFEFRMGDLARWFELLTFDAVNAEELDPARLADYKLVLPNLIDEGMSAQNIDLLDRYVRGGGKVILTAVTGRYCPELGAQTFPLLRRLGITPPQQPFQTTGAAIAAQAESNSPFFAAGQTLGFFTLQNLRELPQKDESIRKSFFTWAYRWIPQADYFGWYPDHPAADGLTLARFREGGKDRGCAASLHQVGKGEVLVFWGTPDYARANMSGFMRKAADWAGVREQASDNPIKLMFQARNEQLKRYYAILWQPQPGTYTQKIPDAPDGAWWADELVQSQKLGNWSGRELREKGIPLTFLPGQSPLKIIRLIVPDSRWMKLYRQVPAGQDK